MNSMQMILIFRECPVIISNRITDPFTYLLNIFCSGESSFILHSEDNCHICFYWSGNIPRIFHNTHRAFTETQRLYVFEFFGKRLSLQQPIWRQYLYYAMRYNFIKQVISKISPVVSAY